MKVIKQTFGQHCLMCGCPKGSCSGRHGLKGRTTCHCINWGYSDWATKPRIIELKGTSING